MGVDFVVTSVFFLPLDGILHTIDNNSIQYTYIVMFQHYSSHIITLNRLTFNYIEQEL